MRPTATLYLFQRCAAAGVCGNRDAAVRAADGAAWSLFVETYGRLLQGGVRSAFFRSGVRFTREDVEEALQEVYCRLLEQGRRRLREFRGSRDIQARRFLRRICTAVVVDSLRRGAAGKRGAALQVDAEALAEPLAEVVPAPEPSPEERLLRRERYGSLVRGCRQIAARSPRGRRNLRILKLAVVDGRSSREIARRMAGPLSVSAIDSVVHRMRRDLAALGLHLPGRRF